MGDLSDIIGDLFGMGRQQSRGPRRGHDIEIEVVVEFKEAVFGAEKKLELNRRTICDRCSGRGGEPGSKLNTCSTCKGAGQVKVNQNILFGNIQSVRPCPQCGGMGQIPDKVCNECDGSGSVVSTKKVSVKIPAGIDHGQSIRLTGQGEAGEQGMPAGDLYVKVLVRADKEFRRAQKNVMSKHEIAFPVAALGGTVKVKTLDGEASLKIPSGTQGGQVFKLKDHGVPDLGGYGRGDHLVEIVVKVPEKLSSREKEIIRELGDEMGVKL